MNPPPDDHDHQLCVKNALMLGASHDFEDDHAKQVAKLAVALYDQFTSLHGLNKIERTWLECAALPHLRDGAEPAIVINLSSSVRQPIPGLTTSNVLRPGLAGLIKNLGFEIAPIRINGVAPGRFATDRVRQLDGARAAGRAVDGDDLPAARRQGPLARADGAAGAARPGQGASAAGMHGAQPRSGLV